MRILNADSRGYDFYDAIIVCRNEKEFDLAMEKLNADDFWEIISVEELAIDICAERYNFDTKKEFIKEVRRFVKS